MQNKSSSQEEAWAALGRHYKDIAPRRIAGFFDEDAERADAMSIKLGGALFDYSKNHVNAETMALLCNLAAACDVEGQRAAMFGGEIVNTTENRAVLHPALRGSTDPSLEIDGENVSDFVDTTLQKIEVISNAIRNNPEISDVICIGIGGSDLGPRMACDALADFADGPNVHFISNIDGHKLARLLKALDAKKTAVIIASKTFTTLETMTNARTVRDWIGEDNVAARFYALTSNDAAAHDFGIKDAHILPMRDWIGGRYSVWGAVGLPIVIAIGFEKFKEFLEGAKAADKHFLEAPINQNIPIIMALLGVWYTRFFGYQAHALLPYSQGLSQFITFVQQLDMESSGKSVDINGNALPYSTGGLLFGGAGTNAQHAFFQLLHQGTQIIPCDFIAIVNPNHDLNNHHTALLGNAVAQAQALMQGAENKREPHRHFEGNRPSSMIVLDRLDPYHLGFLMAIYEHKVFVQGVLWNINSFDQWGVELGKELAAATTEAIESAQISDALDPSSKNIVSYILDKTE